jgi:methyl-accepting chemotaxis protein
VRHNAENALQAKQLASKAANVAQEGEIAAALVAETMREISASSVRIHDIVSVIDSIAFQTNILALNAAVEAARAGEQGQGFAVVAGEVRTLANRSAESAKEIRSLVASSASQVGKGADLVAHAGQTMQSIVDSVRRVDQLLEEISAASLEQSTGVAQVGEAISIMDQATQQNSALVDQMSAAAAGLQGQAGELVRTVSAFEIETPPTALSLPAPHRGGPQLAWT